MQRLRPRKSLGQHFLKDKNIARKIVAALSAGGCHTIIEIGPGTGVLTSLLAENTDKPVYFVEVDPEAVKLLIETMPSIKDRIIHQDFLRLDIAGLFKPPLALIGNLPYNISSQIFFRILENRNLIREVVCMVQKEVARRIASQPHTKEYGILSVLLQAYYKIEYLFTVSPGVFYPPPKVDSAVIRLTRNDSYRLPCNEELFYNLVKVSFNQRRKMLRNSLSEYISGFSADDPVLTKRPEQLSVSDFTELTKKVEERLDLPFER